MNWYPLILALALMACSNNDSAAKVLRAQGYSEIRTTGYSFLCGQEDIIATGFYAISPAGYPTKGAVCEGMMKGATIRFSY